MTPTLSQAAPVTILDRKTGTSLRTGDGIGGLKATDGAVREEIQHRAYARWEDEGHPRDRTLANWLEAEKDGLRHG